MDMAPHSQLGVSPRIAGILVLFACLIFSFILSLFSIPVFAQEDLAKKEAALEGELSNINDEIKDLNSTIGALKTQGVSLDRDIKLLNANINKANLNIKAKNIEISRLSEGIAEKTRTIKNLSVRIDREKQSLAQLIRKTNEIDQASLAEMLLSKDDLSDFFLDLDSFDAIRGGLKSSSDSLKSARVENESAQVALEERQDKEMDVRAELESNKKAVQANEKEKQRLLSITKNKEKEYKKVLTDREKRAAQIRVALFALRDSGEIKFGEALEFANLVSRITGVRPAYLLAVFQQESSFGKNQGSCYLRNTSNGTGVGARTGSVIAKVMNPTRDVPVFLEITGKLGRDPLNTRVSCPQSIGWGGAMGAAQFIPSTWRLFEKRIADSVGATIVDPWNPRDAFMAAGIYLSDLGANKQTYSAERDAACKYFSGKKCSSSSIVTTYGNQVMQKAETIQTTMIDPLQN
jgi:membrane-bound lytic murein transglycosylase B